MARSLGAGLRRCVSASPIWKDAQYSEDALILTTSASSAVASPSAAVPVTTACKSRRWSCSNYIMGGSGAAKSIQAFTFKRARLWRQCSQDYKKITPANYSAFGAPAFMRRWRLLMKKLQSRFDRWMRTSSSCMAGPPERNLNIDLLYDPISYALNFDDGCLYRAPSHNVFSPSKSLL